MTTTLPCPVKDKAGTVCAEPFTVEMDGDSWASYTPPKCGHHVSPRYLREQALLLHQEHKEVRHAEPVSPARADDDGPQGSVGIPASADGLGEADQPPQTPDLDSGAAGEPATERAGATCPHCGGAL